MYRGTPTGTVDVTAGFPVESTVTEAPGTLLLPLPAGRAAVITHHGSYESLPTTYDVLGRWMRKHGLAAGTAHVGAVPRRPGVDTGSRRLGHEDRQPRRLSRPAGLATLAA